MDNNYKDGIDDEDPACNAPVSLTVTNPTQPICDYQTQSFGIKFTNKEDIDIEEVTVTDKIYNSNNILKNTGNANCEIVRTKGTCSDTYNVNLNAGSYYHNAVANGNGQELMKKDNYTGFTVLSNDNVA